MTHATQQTHIRIAKCGHEYAAPVPALTRKAYCEDCKPQPVAGQCSVIDCVNPPAPAAHGAGKRCLDHRKFQPPALPVPTVCALDGCSNPPRKRTAPKSKHPRYCDEHGPKPAKYAPGERRPCVRCGTLYCFDIDGGTPWRCVECLDVTLPCTQCGKAVPASVGGKYCGAACRKRAKPPCSVDGCGRPWFAKGFCQTHYNKQNPNRAFLYGSKPDAKVREVLYERDKGACGICGDPVSRDLPTLDPMAATIDHVIPRTKGGSDDLSNLQLAHRRCNGRKGTKTAADATDGGPTSASPSAGVAGRPL